MIDFAILDKFPDAKKGYKEDPSNWYAFLNARKTLQSYVLFKDKNMWIRKSRPDLNESVYEKFTLKEAIDTEQKRQFGLKKVDKELIIKKVKDKKNKELVDIILKILDNPKIKNDESSNVIVEGPIYMNYEGPPLPSVTLIRDKKYLALYLQGSPVHIFLEGEDRKRFLEMDRKLERRLSDNFRYMYG